MVSLGIDIGGTGCKCVAFEEGGRELALSYLEYPLAAGSVNLPPEILLSSVLDVIAGCVAKLEDPSQVKAITVSSFGESFVSVDRDGKPLGDILLYFADSASGDFDSLVKEIGEERFMDIARILPDPSYSLSKMLLTLKTAPRPVGKFLFVAGYICYELCGKAVCDISLACRSLLYDVKGRCWSQELLEKTGIPEELLPTVLPTGSIAGDILPEIAAKLGLAADVRIVIGSHDQIVNALGAGVARVGEAVDTSGTCECLTPLFASMPEDFGFQANNFACVPYLEDRGYVTYAYNISAGSVVRWYRDALGAGESYSDFNRTAPAEPTGLLVLPFLQGMGGTPDVDAGATGAILGLTTSTRRPDIYRAILEGISFEMRYNQEKLGDFGVGVKTLYACGGGARSEVWLQIKADILGCDIIPVGREETGAMGSAILGISAVTGRSPFDVAKAFLQYGEPVHPNPEHQAIYDRRYEIYRTFRNYYKGKSIK